MTDLNRTFRIFASCKKPIQPKQQQKTTTHVGNKSLCGGICRYETPLQHTRRIARRSGADGRLVSRVRSLCDKSRRSENQPRLSGRRFLLHPVGVRDRLRLRRPVETNDGKGVCHATVHPSASDGGNRRGDRGRHVLLSGLLRMGRLESLGDDAADSDPDERLHDSGHARHGDPGRDRNVPAERSELVAVLRVYRQHPLCAVHPQAADQGARGAGAARRMRTGGVCHMGSLRRHMRGVLADGRQHSRRVPEAVVLVLGGTADVARIQARDGKGGVLDMQSGRRRPAGRAAKTTG